ncbi:uncharacterized protein EV422DRAFT_618458 [Fimicolochytrium jonesii]|uniref:uncharacterized protein n=1 Tax=Fimicolochytrium jonesii TaxID=1396493 RepID=UPI0022FF0C0D|nr:uncharacterized protein EV422DRAFT_618458 [Fimicolochytrium jonesii]KAI8823623.1 hypothetical protein EV422DRAFT_618458 [Fimicolochytrium jonesii]
MPASPTSRKTGRVSTAIHSLQSEMKTGETECSHSGLIRGLNGGKVRNRVVAIETGTTVDLQASDYGVRTLSVRETIQAFEKGGPSNPASTADAVRRAAVEPFKWTAPKTPPGIHEYFGRSVRRREEASESSAESEGCLDFRSRRAIFEGRIDNGSPADGVKLPVASPERTLGAQPAQIETNGAPDAFIEESVSYPEATEPEEAVSYPESTEHIPSPAPKPTSADGDVPPPRRSPRQHFLSKATDLASPPPSKPKSPPKRKGASSTRSPTKSDIRKVSNAEKRKADGSQVSSTSPSETRKKVKSQASSSASSPISAAEASPKLTKSAPTIAHAPTQSTPARRTDSVLETSHETPTMSESVATQNIAEQPLVPAGVVSKRKREWEELATINAGKITGPSTTRKPTAAIATAAEEAIVAREHVHTTPRENHKRRKVEVSAISSKSVTVKRTHIQRHKDKVAKGIKATAVNVSVTETQTKRTPPAEVPSSPAEKEMWEETEVAEEEGSWMGGWGNSATRFLGLQ